MSWFSSKPSLGMIVLAAWLIASNLFPLIGFTFSGMATVVQATGIAAGVLILLNR